MVLSKDATPVELCGKIDDVTGAICTQALDHLGHHLDQTDRGIMFTWCDIREVAPSFKMEMTFSPYGAANWTGWDMDYEET